MSRGNVRMVDETNVGNTLRTPPHNYEAERALLGAILMNKRAIERVEEFLQPDHFADPVNGRIYEFCLKLFNQNIDPNPVTLKGYLDKDDLVAPAGGSKYLASLAAGAVTVINAAEYGRIVEDLWRRRQLIDLAESLANEAYSPDPDASAIQTAEWATSQLDLITAAPTQARNIDMPQAVDSTIADWQAAHKGDAAGISTGLGALDDVVGYLSAGDLIFIAGNTSMGKTALAITLADSIAAEFLKRANGVRTAAQKVAFFSLEMPVEQLTTRLLTAKTGIPGPRQRRWNLNDQQWATLISAGDELKKLPLITRHAPGLTLSALRSGCRQLKRKVGGLGLVVVDYLQIMRPANERDNRVQQIAALTMGLKNLAGEMGCPFIVLSQLSRENWRRENPRPILPDLRDSGSIEQDGDGVWFCYRHEYFLERTKPEKKENEDDSKFSTRIAKYEADLEKARGVAEVIVAKNRHGPPGIARCKFDAPRAWFSDREDYKQPPAGHPAAEQIPLEGF